MPRKLAKSMRFALDGIKDVYKTQRNMRIHFALAVAAVCLGTYLKLSGVEWAVIILTIFMVFIIEILNTSLEILVNHVHPDKGDTARIVKDIAASAVLLACVCAIIVGCLIFLPHLIAF